MCTHADSLDAFSHKLETSSKSASTVSAEALLSPPSLSAWQQNSAPKTPPRLVSDQLLNIYFQEWAPFYPVVHRPTILKLYDQFTTNPDAIENDKYAPVQLNLIFGVAAISSTVCSSLVSLLEWTVTNTTTIVPCSARSRLFRTQVDFETRCAFS